MLIARDGAQAKSIALHANIKELLKVVRYKKIWQKLRPFDALLL